MKLCLLLGSNGKSYDLFDDFFGFQVSSFLHCDFTEGIDIHSGVGKFHSIVFDFDLSFSVFIPFERCSQ